VINSGKTELATHWHPQTEKTEGQNGERRQAMGDKGGKKDKEKSQKQNAKKQQETSKKKLDKQAKRTPSR
jgi:hypothetical protein